MSEFAPYDVLDVPLIVVRSRKVVYANDQVVRALGVSRDHLMGYEIGSDPVRTRLVSPREFGTAVRLMEVLEAGGQVPRDWWMEIPSPAGYVRTCVRTMHGARPDEFIFMLLDVPGLAEGREFSEAMIQAAPEMLRGRTEQEVLEWAVPFLSKHQLFATVLHFRPEGFVHGPMHQDPEGLAEASRLYGKPLTEVVFPLSSLPHMEESIRTRRATFHPDVFEVVGRMHIPEVMADIKRRLPHMPAVDAPIFVEDQPYGALALMGPSLTPAMAVSVELFVQLMGSAIERARHSARAEQRLQEMQRLQRELVERERLATLGQASAVVAHEVRNPLGAIINAVAVLHRDKGLRGDSAQVVKVIEEEAHRLDRLVSDLLVFARPMLARHTRCDLQDVAQRAANPLRHERDDVVLTVAEAADSPAIQADGDLLVLGVQNLLRNALQVSPRGGEVRLSIGCDAGVARISVHDQGPGVPEQEVEKIFAPFFTTRATGTGLGLAVVNRVADAHDGKVTVGRSPLGGAEFTLELPREPKPERLG